jgi:type IV pilus assembly protein PilX
MRHHMTTASGNARTRGFPGFRVQGEQGMVLVVSLIILMLLTLLAVTAMRMSVVEEVMTGNQKLAANALFAAEQGVSAAIEDLLDQTVSDAGSQTDVSWSAAGTVGTSRSPLRSSIHPSGTTRWWAVRE